MVSCSLHFISREAGFGITHCTVESVLWGLLKYSWKSGIKEKFVWMQTFWNTHKHINIYRETEGKTEGKEKRGSIYFGTTTWRAQALEPSLWAKSLLFYPHLVRLWDCFLSVTGLIMVPLALKKWGSDSPALANTFVGNTEYHDPYPPGILLHPYHWPGTR